MLFLVDFLVSFSIVYAFKRSRSYSFRFILARFWCCSLRSSFCVLLLTQVAHFAVDCLHYAMFICLRIAFVSQFLVFAFDVCELRAQSQVNEHCVMFPVH